MLSSGGSWVGASGGSGNSVYAIDPDLSDTVVSVGSTTVLFTSPDNSIFITGDNTLKKISFEVSTSYLDGLYWKQGGNSWTAIGVIGTNDAYDLKIRTNSLTRMTITSDGRFGIGATPQADIAVYSATTSSPSGDFTQLRLFNAVNLSHVSSNAYNAIWATSQAQPGGGVTQYGPFQNLIESVNAGAGTVTSMYGVAGKVSNSGAGIISSGVGIAGIVLNSSPATVTNAIGVYGYVGTSGIDTGYCINASYINTITTAYGVYIGAVTSDAAYGIYIADSVSGTSIEYAFKSNSAKQSAFGGRLGVGGNCPATEMLYVGRGWTPAFGSVSYASEVLEAITGAGGATAYTGAFRAHTDVTLTGSHGAIRNDFSIAINGTVSIAEVDGLFVKVDNSNSGGSGAIALCYGVYATILNTGSRFTRQAIGIAASSINSTNTDSSGSHFAVGLYSNSITASGSAASNTAYGLYISSISSANTSAKSAGIYIGDSITSTGGTAWSIASDSVASSYLIGDLLVGTLTPDSSQLLVDETNTTGVTRSLIKGTMTTSGASSANAMSALNVAWTIRPIGTVTGFARNVVSTIIDTTSSGTLVAPRALYCYYDSTGASGAAITTSVSALTLEVLNTASTKNEIKTAIGLEVGTVTASGGSSASPHVAYGIYINTGITASGGSSNNAYSIGSWSTAPSFFAGDLRAGTLTDEKAQLVSNRSITDSAGTSYAIRSKFSNQASTGSVAGYKGIYSTFDISGTSAADLSGNFAAHDLQATASVSNNATYSGTLRGLYVSMSATGTGSTSPVVSSIQGACFEALNSSNKAVIGAYGVVIGNVQATGAYTGSKIAMGLYIASQTECSGATSSNASYGAAISGGTATASGSATSTTYGIQVSNSLATGGATSICYGVYIDGVSSTSATTSNSYGVYINSVSSTSGTTNAAYGIYIANSITGAQATYSIYSGTTAVGYFEARVDFKAGIKVKNTGTGSTTFDHYHVSASDQSLGTLTWTGTAAPSGSVTKIYNWTRIGRQVHLRWSIAYSVAGTACTRVSFVLPGDCPTPALWASPSTGDYQGLGQGSIATLNSLMTNQGNSGIYYDGANWAVITVAGANNTKGAMGEIFYDA